jgi:hypothetical protein
MLRVMFFNADDSDGFCFDGFDGLIFGYASTASTQTMYTTDLAATQTDLVTTH